MGLLDGGIDGEHNDVGLADIPKECVTYRRVFAMQGHYYMENKVIVVI